MAYSVTPACVPFGRMRVILPVPLAGCSGLALYQHVTKSVVTGATAGRGALDGYCTFSITSTSVTFLLSGSVMLFVQRMLQACSII
jgi:hypothetical protein